MKNACTFAPVVYRLGHRAFNPKSVGSIPRGSTMTKAKISTAIFLVTASCAGFMYITTPSGTPIKNCYTPVTFVIADESPEKLKEALKRGVLYWNEAIGHDIFFDFGDVGLTLDGEYSSAFYMVGVVSELPLSRKNRAMNSHPCGRTAIKFNSVTGCISSAKIRISMMCAGDINEFETMVRHEAGHVLGLSDTVDFTALMSGNIERTMQHPVDANEAEIKAVKKLYGLEKK